MRCASHGPTSRNFRLCWDNSPTRTRCLKALRVGESYTSEMSRFGHSPHKGTLGSSTLEESPMPNLLCQCPVTKRPLRLLIGCKGKIIEDLSRLVSNPAPCEHCDQYHAWAIQDLYFEGERADSAGSVN